MYNVWFNHLTPTFKGLHEIHRLIDPNIDINKQFFITYPAIYTAKFTPKAANLLVMLFIGYIDKLRKKNKMLAINLLKGLLERYNKRPIINLRILRLFGVEWNKKAKLIPQTALRLMSIISVLELIIKRVIDDEQDVRLFMIKDNKVLFAGIKHLIIDGISNLQQEKEQSKETKKYKEEAKNYINGYTIITERSINKELELFCELFNCRIILFTTQDKKITQKVFDPPLVFYRICSVHMFYFFYEKVFSMWRTDVVALSGLLYKQELLSAYYKELYKREDLPPKREDLSLIRRKKLDLPYIEPRAMTILRQSTTFAAEVYMFLTRLVKKEARYDDLKKVLKMTKELKKMMLNSEIEELEEDFNVIENCREVLKNRDLVKKTIFANELVKIKRGDCSRCRNKNVKIIEGTAACTDELSHCLWCMKQGNTYKCPKCNKELEEDVISLMTQENCTLCGQTNVILPCGDSADIGCLKEQMVKAKKDMKGFSKIMCEKHNKEIGYEVLKQVDDELSAILSLNEFIICSNG